MDVNLLKPCPVCGKKPKVKITYGKGNCGCLVRIRCKPWWRRTPHISIEVCKAQDTKAKKAALKEWNYEVDVINFYGCKNI